MKEKLHVYYDKEGDVLEIRMGKPTIASFKDLGNDVFERIDEKSGEIKGFAIFNFNKRSEKLKSIDVSLPFGLKMCA
ncbi:DUF2283 domain-containing protein [archaeon]|nr:DUF2283 domain-containing protein [archaeon]|tara:strand:+ start:483 stop:713 length:231 start_codon:yes stop_codon:yes gene_type:complete